MDVNLDKEMDEEGIKPEKLVKDLRIITAISLGKDRNKELAKFLDTDKSFTSKKVRELEQRGLIKKEGEGKETRYSLDIFNVMRFLQSRIIITSSKKEGGEKDSQKDKRNKGEK